MQKCYSFKKYSLICSCHWKVNPCLSLFMTNSTLLLLSFVNCGRLEEFVTKPWLQNLAINTLLYFYQKHSLPPQSFRTTLYYFRLSVSHWNVFYFFGFFPLSQASPPSIKNLSERSLNKKYKQIYVSAFKITHGKKHECYNLWKDQIRLIDINIPTISF